MNRPELRRLGALLRPGHLVTTQSGQQFEVFREPRYNRVMCMKQDNGLDLGGYHMLSISEVALGEDQITPADQERVAQQAEVRRKEFLRLLNYKLKQYTYPNVKVHEGNCRAVEQCKNLAYGTNLFIYGGSGNGKTMLAVATAYDLAAYYSVAVWSAVEWFEKIRGSFNTYNQTERPDLKSPEVLVLDDIGKSKASDFAYEQLYNVVNYRWEQGRTTIFTSNHSARATAQKVSPDIDNASALLSRMASGNVVEVTGRDQRVLQGRMNDSAQHE